MDDLDNKGFSLVELIIVVAIMATLVGVLAPQYMRYLEKTEKTRDCATINTLLDICETIAMDPDTTWGSGNANAIEFTVANTGITYEVSAGTTMMAQYVTDTNAYIIAGDWGPFTITAVRDDNGRVTFDIADADKTLLGQYSSALVARLQ